MQFRNLPLVTALAATAFALPQDSSGASGTCDSFKQVQNEEYTQYLDPIRVSPGVVCSEDNAGPNGTCAVQAWAFATYRTRLNVTADENQRSALIDLLAPDEDDQLQRAKDGLSGILANRTLQLEKGNSGYAEFAEKYTCTNRVPQGCQGDLSSFSGVVIQACYPAYVVGNGTARLFPPYVGLYIYPVDQEMAESLTDRPYGVDRADNLVPKG